MGGLKLNRSEVEKLPCRATTRFEIADVQERGDEFRITGVMNSFRPMRSGRIMHPAGYQEWIKKNAGQTLNMLAQHGYVSGAFATIGKWDNFTYDEQRGAVWSGFVGGGTELCEETRTLLRQKLISGLSWGWYTSQARWVRTSDADIDPYFKRVMEEDGVDECYAFLRYEVVEGSIVDVQDDRLGLLAASHGPEMAALLKRFDGVEEKLAALSGGAASGDRKPFETELKEMFRGFAAETRQAIAEQVEGILSDPAADYATRLFADDDGCCAHGEPAAKKTSGSGRDRRAALSLLRDVVAKH